MKIITKNKTKLAISAFISVSILYICYKFYQPYMVKGLIAAILLFILSALHIELPFRANVLRFIHYFLIIGLTFSISSISLIGNLMLLKTMDIFKVALNIFGILSLCIVFYTLFLNERVSVVIGTGLYLAAFIINTLVYWFRGRELTPLDIRSIKTAMNVAGNYDISLSFFQFWGILIWCISIISLWTISYRTEPESCFKEKSVFLYLKKRILPFVLSFTVIIIFCFQCSKTEINLYGFEGTQKNGFLVSFTSNLLSDAKIRKDPLYSIKNVEELEKQYANSSVAENDETIPTVIVIMDEAFSDLRLLDNKGVIPENVMPFFDSLKDNTIKGYALSSVFGGNTANSEYELLTGNTLGFISPNAVVYQQFLSGQYYSMVSVFNNLGYKTIGTHPFSGTSWQRDTVFPMLGFDKSIFIDEYPNETFIRTFISDSEMFDKVINIYEDTVKTQKLFLFGITVQNHGGYTLPDGPSLAVDGLSRQYPDAEQYLGLIHETDAALKEFVSYFQNIDDKVIIVFYGDHLPNLESSFYDEIYSKSFDTLDDQQKKFLVPFFIWANYDIEEKTLPCTSLNFLSSYIYEAARIKLPSYNRFLQDVEYVVPSMNAYGYYSKAKNCFMKYSDATGEEKDILEKYRTLQYNSLFDEDNLSSLFFPIGN